MIAVYSIFPIFRILLFYAGDRELNALTTEEVMSLFAHLKLGNDVNDVATSALDVATSALSNCEAIEEILELVKLGRVRARLLLINVKKWRDAGVPPRYLIPLGTLIELFIIKICTN